MEGDSTPQEKRQRLLRAVRNEIERDLEKGTAVSSADWRERYPDLEPELGNMLAEIVTQVGIKPQIPHWRPDRRSPQPGKEPRLP